MTATGLLAPDKEWSYSTRLLELHLYIYIVDVSHLEATVKYIIGVLGPRAPLGMLFIRENCLILLKKSLREWFIAVLEMSSLFLIQETDKTLTFSREVKPLEICFFIKTMAGRHLG